MSAPEEPAPAPKIALLTDTPRPFREPVSEPYFQGMRSRFVAAAEPPAQIDRKVVRESSDRLVEEVTLRYPTDDPFVLYLAQPRPAPGALQTAIYMPHGGAFLMGKTPNKGALNHIDYEIDFIVRSGRAVIVPIWKGSRERYVDFLAGKQHEAAAAWHDDLTRTLAFIEDEPSLADEQVAFVGFSYGALLGAVLLGLDDRLKTGVLISGGIFNTFPLDESLDMTNYAPRIQQPVLMVNGRFDPIVPWGLAQKRLLELLPNDNNRQVLFDELGHFGFPRHRFYRAVTDWLDEQLGPPR